MTRYKRRSDGQTGLGYGGVNNIPYFLKVCAAYYDKRVFFNIVRGIEAHKSGNMFEVHVSDYGLLSRIKEVFKPLTGDIWLEIQILALDYEAS